MAAGHAPVIGVADTVQGPGTYTLEVGGLVVLVDWLVDWMSVDP